MKVATIDVLTEEGRFEPGIARAIAKAIGMEISREPFATKADVIALGQVLRLEMRDFKVEVIRWIFLNSMGTTATLIGVMYFFLQNMR